MISRSTRVLAVVSRAAAGNPGRCFEAHINSSARILRILVCGWSDYASIHVPGLFALPETFVPSHFAAGDEWLWFWIRTHKQFDPDFPADSSRE